MPGYFNSANSNGTSNNGNSNGTSNNGNSNGTSNNGNSNDTSKSDGNSSSDYLNSLNSSSSVTQQVTNLIGIIGKSLSNEGRAGSNGNGLKFIEVSIKDTINTIKNNPYTILAIFALLALIGLGYFKRAKFN
jgi:hypothetical protein